MKLYAGDQASAIVAYDSEVSLALTSEMSWVQFGPSFGPCSPAPPTWLDELQLGSAAGGWIGIAAGSPLSQPPTAIAEPDVYT